MGHQVYGGALDNKTRSELEVCHVHVSGHCSFLGMDRIVSCMQDRTSYYFLRAASQRKRNDCSHTTRSELITITISSNSRLCSHPDGDITVRMERFGEAQSYTDAFSYLSKFYIESGSAGTCSPESRGRGLAELRGSSRRAPNRVPQTSDYCTGAHG